MIYLIIKINDPYTISLNEYPEIVPVTRSTQNQIRWKQKTTINNLDLILNAAYSFYVTMDIISQRQHPNILSVILVHDNVELFKFYAWNMSDSDIHSHKNDISLLGESLRFRSKKIIKYLLTDKKFHNVDVTDHFKVKRGMPKSAKSRNIPLMWAVHNKRVNTLSLLLNHPKMTKECINGTKMYGPTALYFAITSDPSHGLNVQTKMIKLLINDERTNCNVQRGAGMTALMAAVGMYGHSKLVKALLSNENCNIDVNFQNRNKDTVLHYIADGKMRPTSVREQQIKSAKLLIKRPDLDVNILNAHGKTALQIAKDTNYEEIVKLLTE